MSPGPNLPDDINQHCLTKVNETHFFLAGGYTSNSGNSKKAYMINFVTQQWTTLPDMSFSRVMASCQRIPEDILVIGEAL